ncbi:hypothetical protein SLEP1_g5714 [Rubroshorea leprosula]|uniref:RRM domain-containing protein n=1 Tax=Rubroshorea leprosula TaxID=152421 RepID=A0AAV5I1U8_9ROSI|nr:hypothetical protein SLEP1_g5714 [Rubroshorea leprosula]
MSSRLNMSLDEISRTRTRSEGRYGVPRGRGSSHGPGPDRLAPTRDHIRANPYPVLPMFNEMQGMQVPEALWQQDLTQSEIHDSEEGTKLYISNLDYNVTDSDIQVLFSEVGDLKSYSIHYGMSGRSKGTGEVVFRRQTDALAAIKRYSNVRLDGKPLKIEIVGVNLVTPAPVPLNLGRPAPLPLNLSIPAPMDSSENIIPRKRAKIASSSIREKVGAREMHHGGGGRGFARNRERQERLANKLTFADLDADLDKYRLQALQQKK